MSEAIKHPEHSAIWQAAIRGDAVNWNAFLAHYDATLDWPACGFWRELREANPDATVLLSSRSSAESWWESMEKTIIATLSRPVPADDTDWAERRQMTLQMMDRFDPRWKERDSAIAAYRRHNEAVRSAVPAERLVDWQPGDDWQPICAALHLSVPDEPFPHVNTRAAFRASQEVE